MMSHNGLVKLMEECGEVIQVAAKLVAFPELQRPQNGFAFHPDGTDLRERLIEEIGDVLGALEFVSLKLELDPKIIKERSEHKLRRFQAWDMLPSDHSPRSALDLDR